MIIVDEDEDECRLVVESRASPAVTPSAALARPGTPPGKRETKREREKYDTSPATQG